MTQLSDGKRKNSNKDAVPVVSEKTVRPSV